MRKPKQDTASTVTGTATSKRNVTKWIKTNGKKPVNVTIETQRAQAQSPSAVLAAILHETEECWIRANSANDPIHSRTQSKDSSSTYHFR